MNSLQKLDYICFSLAKEDGSICADFHYQDENTPTCEDCPYLFDGECHYQDGWNARTNYIKGWLFK